MITQAERRSAFITSLGTIIDNDLTRDRVIRAFDALEPIPAEMGTVLVSDALVDPERLAQIMAHRACIGAEHNPQQGKLHGCCVICGDTWPCPYAGPVPK